MLKYLPSSTMYFPDLIKGMIKGVAQAHDMTGDVEPHGSRELVIDELAANNQVNRVRVRNEMVVWDFL